jgi:hypothetical protein
MDPLANKFVYLSPYNYASNNPITNLDLWGLQGFASNLFLDLFVKYATIISEAKNPVVRLLTGTSSSRIPAEAKNSMTPQTKTIYNAISKANDVKDIGKTVSKVGSEVINDAANATETTGEVITGTAYAAAIPTGGESLALVPLGEGLTNAGKGAQALVCYKNNDFSGATELAAQIGVSTLTTELVDSAVDKTVKAANGAITNKEIAVHVGVLGAIGELFKKVVDLVIKPEKKKT